MMPKDKTFYAEKNRMTVHRLFIVGWMTCAVLMLGGCGSSTETANTTGGSASQGSDKQKAKDSDKKPSAPTAGHVDSAADEENQITREIAINSKVERIQFSRDNPKIERQITIRKFSDDTYELNGKFSEFWWNDGKSGKFVEGNYTDGKRDGKQTYYHANGQVARTVTYVDGKPDGQWTRYLEDGSRHRDVSYKAGKRDGTWTSYRKKEEGDEDGQQKIVLQGAYKDGKRDGVWTGWHKNGKKMSEISYVKGVKSGFERSWYESGAKRSEAQYANNVLNGTATFWSEEGKALKREFKNGEPVSKSGRQVAAK